VYPLPIFSSLTAFLVLDIWLWFFVRNRLARVRNGAIWRLLMTILMLPPALFTFLTIVAFRKMADVNSYIPSWIGAYVYIWNFLIALPMGAAILTLAVIEKIRAAWRELRRRLRREKVAAPPETAPQPLLSRRNFLSAIAATAPPLAAASLTGISESQFGNFRVQPYDLKLPGWPAELDGFTITLVADVHTGIFSTEKMLNSIADRANNLRSDLMLLGGDLVNLSHKDLPGALDMVMKMDARYGVYMVQGNHDVVQPASEFNSICRRRGVNLLVDELVSLNPSGIPIQLLGTRWPKYPGDMELSVATVAAQRDPLAFPILLAHHPHSFDEAQLRGIPLILSGHTHGGQIMLTKNIGGGPLRFKYWTGIYEKPGSTLVVSNGVGNWFPLRVNAPAEINHITLHPADVA
jgi:uncharacterized protein